MNTLLIILIMSNFQYGNLCHLPGYYTYSDTGFSFKHCYEDETRTVIQKDDILLVIDYLEETHKIKLSKKKDGLINVWTSDSKRISIVGITNDYVNYIIEVKYDIEVTD